MVLRKWTTVALGLAVIGSVPLSANAQQAAQPAEQLPPIEVLAKNKAAKAQKKSKAPVQAKKAPPPSSVAPASEPLPSAETTGVGSSNTPAAVASELRDSTTGTSTISAADAARSGDSNVYEALTSLPNVTPAPNGPTLPAIRGESVTPTTLFGSYYNGVTPRMVLSVDDIPRISSYANNSFQSLYDIKSIQVLRGPQHTLAGSNAFAGAYIVETNDPVFAYSAGTFSEITYNEYSGTNHRYAGFANVPFSSEAAMRLVAQYEKGEIPVDLVGGADPNLDDYDNLSLRGKLLVEPDSVPGLSVVMSGEYTNGLDNVFNGFVDVPPFSDRKRTGIDHRISNTEGWAAGIRANYRLSAREEISSITSYVHDNYASSPRSTSSFNFNDMTEERFAQDFTYSFRNLANFTGVVGVGATDGRRDYDADADLLIPIAPPPAPPAPLTAFGLSDSDIKTQAIYADIAWNFAGRFDLLFGGRIERWDDERVFSAGTSSPVPFLNSAVEYSYKDTETFVLPKVGLRYNFGAAETIAVTARKGYNAGGAYVNLQDATLPLELFDAEKVWTYEAAYRTSMMRDRLRLGITAFFNDYEDKQFAIALPLPSSPIRIFNEPDAESYGVEFEAKYAVTPALDVNGGFGLLKTKITGVRSTDVVFLGNDFGQDPSYSVSLGAAWRPVDNLELNARGTYVDNYYSDFRNNALTVAGGYTLVDIGASYRFANATARVFVNNVTDEVAAASVDMSAPNAFLLDPRTYGASLDLKF